jgi:hypothetical protein
VREGVAIGALLAIYLMGVFGGVTQGDSPKLNKMCRFFLLAQIPVLQTQAITYHLISLFSFAIAFTSPANLTFSWFFWIGLGAVFVHKRPANSVRRESFSHRDADVDAPLWGSFE